MKPGDRMTWLHIPCGGYGYVYPVNAEIVKINAKTVRIRVAKRSGELIERSVRPESLKPRETKQP